MLIAWKQKYAWQPDKEAVTLCGRYESLEDFRKKRELERGNRRIAIVGNPQIVNEEK